MSEAGEFSIRTRADLERIERATLAPYATRCEGAHATRLHPEEEHPYRTAFQRDRDRIIHSRAFRRLKHKRQVFLPEVGDHYRTRITHTLEVSQIARTMARALGLNEDLVEAIALGHDLGHTPFGHIGEIVLNEIMAGKDDLGGVLPRQNGGGFKHNYQSLRVVDQIEKKYPWEGLNLTAPVREGILKHTRLRRDELNYPDFVTEGLHLELDSATTLEGQVVAISDEIAQRTHDLEDGLRAGLVELQRVRELPLVGLVEEARGLAALFTQDPFLYRNLLIRGLINLLANDVIENTLRHLEDFQRRKARLHFFDEEVVTFSARLNPLQKQLNQFIYQEIIFPGGQNPEDRVAESILRGLFRIYVERPELLPEYTFQRYADRRRPDRPASKDSKALRQDCHFLRVVCDHIAGMTDHFAREEWKKLGP